jgi:hypothetical protein
MPPGIALRWLAFACLSVATCWGMTAVSAKESATKPHRRVETGAGQSAIIVTRIWKDGNACPRGVARLRPLRGTQLDMSRFVDIGYVTLADSRPQLQAMGELLSRGFSLDFKGLFADVNKGLSDRFVPITPGAYVMTSISCQYGNGKAWIGDDHSNLFAAESGRATPIKGANVIDVRSGEILDAGILEIRSDKVGLFQATTGSVVAAQAPENERAQLREVFRDAGAKLRFSNFRAGIH